MKLKKFNESSKNDDIEIIKEAFYNITDEYSLDVKLDITNGLIGHDHRYEIYLNINEDFMIITGVGNDDIDDCITKSNNINTIISKCKVSINNLKPYFKFDSIEVDYLECLIRITFIKI